MADSQVTPWHRGWPATAASFRTWRSLRCRLAQDLTISNRHPCYRQNCCLLACGRY